MHTTSVQSQFKSSNEQTSTYPSWSSQLCKSFVLTASSLGFGWLANKLWTGSNTESPVENSQALALYDKTQAGECLPHPVLFDKSVQIYKQTTLSESLFHKMGIAYNSSDEEIPLNKLDVELTEHPSPLHAQSTDGLNLQALSISYLAASVLAGQLTPRLALTPAMFSLLALSIAGRADGLPYADTPVGTIIAYASSNSLEQFGYVRCDGAPLSKQNYLELHEHLKGHCKEEGEKFYLPDCRNYFLRGAEKPTETDEFGKKYQDTTKEPVNFKAVIDYVDNHNHAAGNFDKLLQVNGEGTAPASDKTAGEPNLFTASSMQPAGGHSHTITISWDSETSPKHIRVAYWIKAKSTPCPSMVGQMGSIIQTTAIVVIIAFSTAQLLAWRASGEMEELRSRLSRLETRN